MTFQEATTRVPSELIARFKGFTAYPRAPASGLRKSPDATVEKDDLIVYKVLTKVRDAEWWAAFRESLEKLIQQEIVLILSHDVPLCKRGGLRRGPIRSTVVKRSRAGTQLARKSSRGDHVIITAQ